MKFVHFLNEAFTSYRTKITKEDAVELIKKHCKNIDKENYIIRGADNAGQFYIMEGQKGYRESRNKRNGNYYTLMIDHMLKKKDLTLPLRSKSIICTNKQNKSQAKLFGNNMYVILPYDDSIIGCVNQPDIWMTETSIGDDFGTLEEYNDLFKDCGISSESYESIVTAIKDIVKNINDDSSSLHKFLSNLFKDDVDNVEKFLNYTYDPDQLDFTFIKSNELSKITHKCEFWIGGPCIAVELSEWDEISKLI